MSEIFCFGQGWLGNLIKKEAVSFNCNITGTSTSGENNTIKWSIGDPIPGEVNGKNIIIAIPAAKWDLDTLATFIKELSKYNLLHVVWISSVGAYPENGKATEFKEARSAVKDLKTIKVKSQEKIVSSYFLKSGVIRMGGLFGYDRHPAKYFTGNRKIPNGEALANMIHGYDAARLVLTVMTKKISGIVNGIPPTLPTRALFYSTAFSSLKLGEPKISTGNKGKHVVSERVGSEIPFDWKYKNPVDAYEMEH